MVIWKKLNNQNFVFNVQQIGNALSIRNAQYVNSGDYECTIEWNRKIARATTNVIVT